VLDKEFIETLPDDEDELATYLQQIAGSRGGTGGGGNFVIDGFGGGRVPPKDQIQKSASITIHSVRNSAASATGVWKLYQARDRRLSREPQLRIQR